jgi:glycosyltransferase involved in cell wall biosynthesis
VRVAFLVNDLQLSGGVGVVVAHARELVERHGFDVTLVLAREQEAPHWRYDTLEHLHVAALPDVHGDRFDIAIGTWWETAFSLFTVPADRYAFFLQSLEDRFYRPDEAPRHMAPLVLDLPVAYITEARWIAAILGDLRPDAPRYLVRNGLDKRTFPATREPAPAIDGPLRILIEGNPDVWFKHVKLAAKATRAMKEPHHVTLVSGMPGDVASLGVDRYLTGLSHQEMAEVYAESHVLLKLSSVEGMFGPPLEGFHMGATCVVTPVTGHEEYVVHGWNGLICDWDDPHGTAALLDLLARDRRLLHHLRRNAVHTARTWPSWEQQGHVMAAILRRIRDEPPPTAVPVASARLMADARAGLEAYGGHLQHNKLLRSRLARFDRVLIATRVSKLLEARRHPVLQRVLRLVRRLRG